MENTNLAYDKDGMQIEVNSSGGMIHRCTFGQDDVNVFYPFTIRDDGKERGGCPICFPAFGSPTKIYEGVAQHGWLRNLYLNTRIKGKYGIMSYGREDVGSQKKGQFAFFVEHSVFSNSIVSHLGFMLEYLQEVESCSDREDIVVRPGFHPYFPHHGKNEVLINGVVHDQFSAEAKCLRISSEDDIVISTGFGGLRMRMTLGGFTGSTCLYLWSDAPDKYFCVEPVFCVKEDFLERRALIVKPGELHELSMRLDILS